MANIVNGHTKAKIENFSVETVRNILNLDNKGIAKLCSQTSLMPKKDINGVTFFTREDLEVLRRAKNANDSVKRQPAPSRKAYATVPVKSMAKQFKSLMQQQPKQTAQRPVQPMQPQALPAAQKSNGAVVVEKICTSLSKMEDSLTGKMADLIDKKLGEKLDGMDEVVGELVRCKTENETLRYKMNELNKELYNLKNEMNKYKSLGLGFYVKKNSDSSLL